jgi:hypothetical protein
MELTDKDSYTRFRQAKATQTFGTRLFLLGGVGLGLFSEEIKYVYQNITEHGLQFVSSHPLATLVPLLVPTLITLGLYGVFRSMHTLYTDEGVMRIGALEHYKKGSRHLQ